MIPFANLCYYCGNYVEDNFMSHYTSAHIRHSVTSDCDILYFERYANGNPFEPLSEEDDFLGHEAECGDKLDEMLNNGYCMGSDCRLYLAPQDFDDVILDDDITEDDAVEYTDGSVYYGRTKNGQPHGYGVMNYNNEDSYMGWWAYGKKNGIGQYSSYDSMKTYYGLYKDGSRNGMGIEFYNGDPQDYQSCEYGRWNGGRCYDRRDYTYARRKLIKGSVDDSYGEILFVVEAGGSAMYVGQLWNRMYHGIGTYYTSDGYQFKCRWMLNKIVEILEVRDTAGELVYDMDSFDYEVIPK